MRATGLPLRLALVETSGESTASQIAFATGLLVRRTAMPACSPRSSGSTRGPGGTIQVIGCCGSGSGNDVPGVLGPRALLRLLVRDGLDVSGRHVLLVGGGQDLWLAATLLAARGAHPAVVLEDEGGSGGLAGAGAGTGGTFTRPGRVGTRHGFGDSEWRPSSRCGPA